MSTLLQDLKIYVTFNVTIPATAWDEEAEIVFTNNEVEFYDYDADLSSINANDAVVKIHAVIYGYSTIDAVHQRHAQNGVDIETNILIGGVPATIQNIMMTDVIGLGI